MVAPGTDGAEDPAETALEGGLDLTYKANGANAKETTLKDGLNFTNGDLTVATVGDNGEVTFDLTDEAKKAITKADDTPFEYAKADGTPLTKVGDKYYTEDQLNDDPTNPLAPNTVTNVKSTLPGSVNNNEPVADKTARTAPNFTGDDAYKLNNAATISDVLEAGWNLQGNDTAVDFVKPYDTVNFKDGLGTKARVETDDKNELNKVFYDVAVDNETTKLVGNFEGNKVVRDKDGNWLPYDRSNRSTSSSSKSYKINISISRRWSNSNKNRYR